MVETQKERLQAYLEAERAILQGQSYTINDRSLTRADLKYVQSQISELMAELNAPQRASTKRVVFID